MQKKEDIDASLECGVDGTIIFIGTSKIQLGCKKIKPRRSYN